MPQVNSEVTANYRRVKTGSQLGTPELQTILIKTYDLDWGTLTTDTNTNNPNIKVSDANTNFAKIVRAVQDYAEIYFIGNPQTNCGGESNVTECMMLVNVNTNTSGGELRSEGQWNGLANHIHNVLDSDPGINVWFAVPDGWIWRAAGMVSTGNDSGEGWFPFIYVY